MGKFSASIDGGFAKGFRVYINCGSVTRPTKSIVKKSLFDTLRYRIGGSVFVDCFCGSGQIGLQSVSLGADRAVFFENDPDAFLNLSDNISRFESRFGDVSVIAYNMDFFESIDILGSINGSVILYMDPPFNTRPGFASIYDRLNCYVGSFDAKVTRKIDIISMELPSDADVGRVGAFSVFKCRKFGRTALKYLKLRSMNG